MLTHHKRMKTNQLNMVQVKKKKSISVKVFNQFVIKKRPKLHIPQGWVGSHVKLSMMWMMMSKKMMMMVLRMNMVFALLDLPA